MIVEFLVQLLCTGLNILPSVFDKVVQCHISEVGTPKDKTRSRRAKGVGRRHVPSSRSSEIPGYEIGYDVFPKWLDEYITIVSGKDS